MPIVDCMLIHEWLKLERLVDGYIFAGGWSIVNCCVFLQLVARVGLISTTKYSVCKVEGKFRNRSLIRTPNNFQTTIDQTKRRKLGNRSDVLIRYASSSIQWIVQDNNAMSIAKWSHSDTSDMRNIHYPWAFGRHVWIPIWVMKTKLLKDVINRYSKGGRESSRMTLDYTGYKH